MKKMVKGFSVENTMMFVVKDTSADRLRYCHVNVGFTDKKSMERAYKAPSVKSIVQDTIVTFYNNLKEHGSIENSKKYIKV